MKSEQILRAMGGVDDALIREACFSETRKRGKAARRFRRPALIAACLALVLSMTVSALAATVPAVNDVLYAILPAAAQALAPVGLSDEDGGIRMEVAAAGVENGEARFYITLRDLTGDRLDETTDLFDSYTIRRGFDSTGSCVFSSYDAASRTASFLVTLTRMDGSNIAGGKVTFTLRELLSHKQEQKDVEVLAALPAVGDGETQKRPLRGVGGSAAGSGLDEAAVLLAAETALATPAEGFAVTALGYVDGQLHIQLREQGVRERDNHGYLYLVDAQGRRIESCGELSFWADEEADVSCTDYLFDVPAADLGDYRLCGSFFTAGTYVEGDWRVTFPLAG